MLNSRSRIHTSSANDKGKATVVLTTSRATRDLIKLADLVTEMKEIKQKQEYIDKAQSLFDEGYACSQSILLAYGRQFNLDERTAKLISANFGGGMGRLRQKCGAVTGGFMVLGLAFGNTDPKDMETKLASYKKVRELNQMVEDIYGTSNCVELLKKHATEAEVAERKHHKIICRRVVGDVAGLIYDMIKTQIY